MNLKRNVKMKKKMNTKMKMKSKVDKLFKVIISSINKNFFISNFKYFYLIGFFL